jgi:ABC-type lipopolysaccharide export system ATPase subunit
MRRRKSKRPHWLNGKKVFKTTKRRRKQQQNQQNDEEEEDYNFVEVANNGTGLVKGGSRNGRCELLRTLMRVPTIIFLNGNISGVDGKQYIQLFAAQHIFMTHRIFVI